MSCDVYGKLDVMATATKLFARCYEYRDEIRDELEYVWKASQYFERSFPLTLDDTNI